MQVIMLCDAHHNEVDLSCRQTYYSSAITSASPKGFTLIEVVVLISVIGILTTLIMPAIQRSRARSRRTQCLANLRQMGIALESFLGANRFYPTGFNGASARAANVEFDFYSPHARLLPHLEQDSIYNSINFSLNLPERGGGYGANEVPASSGISVFLCPADPGGVREGNNYRGNMGVGPWFVSFSDSPTSGTGLFFLKSRINAGAIYDGLSRTVAFSEKIRSDGRLGYSPESEYWHAVSAGSVSPSVDNWMSFCGSLNDPSPSHNSSVGAQWIEGSTTYTLYNHGLPPNSPIPDCSNNPPSLPPIGLFAARSWHQGGVNVVMLDGSAHFVSEDIDLKIWRALGTRAGRETVDDVVFE